MPPSSSGPKTPINTGAQATATAITAGSAWATPRTTATLNSTRPLAATPASHSHSRPRGRAPAAPRRRHDADQEHGRRRVPQGLRGEQRRLDQRPGNTDAGADQRHAHHAGAPPRGPLPRLAFSSRVHACIANNGPDGQVQCHDLDRSKVDRPGRPARDAAWAGPPERARTPRRHRSCRRHRSDFLQLRIGRLRPVARPAGWPTGSGPPSRTAARPATAAGQPDAGRRTGVSRGVVTEAYQRLTDDGLLVDRGRRRHRGRPRPTTARRPAPGRHRSTRRTAPGTSAAPVHRPGRQLVFDALRAAPARIDLSPGAPDLAAFPAAGWLRAERAVLDG